MDIFLNFIFKNEEHVLPRMLKSCLGFIDGVIAVDTGSDDKSVEIIQNFCKENNLKCEVYHYAFTNFADSRNHALSKLTGKDNFGYWMDCDEQLVLPKGFDINKFKSELSNYDSVHVTMVSGIRYNRNSIFRIGLNWTWKGVVHEYLSCTDPCKTLFKSEIEVLIISDGHSWKATSQKEKYLGHARLLKREVEKFNDPRDVFYLASSYRDAGEKKRAIEWYRRRVNMYNGSLEERYIAQLRLSELCHETKQPPEDVLWEYFKAIELDSMRGEAVNHLIVRLQEQNLWNSAYIVGKAAMEMYDGKNPYPNRSLFIDDWVYSKGIRENHRLSCTRTNRIDETLLYGVNEADIDELIESIPSGFKSHRKFANWLIKKINPKITVELGVDYGYSLFCLSEDNKGEVYGIDSFNGDAFTGIRNTESIVNNYLKILSEKHNINNIKILKGDFDKVIQNFNLPIDILHCDGYADYVSVKSYYDTWGNSVTSNGVILIHNTNVYSEIGKFFKEVDLPKFNFNYGGGLGIITKDSSLIESIKKEFSPDIPLIKDGETLVKDKPESEIINHKITIGTIVHNDEVRSKYLFPSLQNLKGHYIFATSDLFFNQLAMPATKYNDLIDVCTTKYLLLVHEDVTFSPDFLDKINQTISDNPDFGALGVVGMDKNGEYQWGEVGKYKEVERFDSCCILINKEHGLRFDDKTFDELHLYVDDYSKQCIAKGLKCLTICTNASEADKDDVYSNEGSYFKHHSVTFNKLGSAWGRYWEYEEKLKNKWAKAISDKEEVDVVILSFAKNEALKKVTEYGIQSLIRSEDNIKFNVFVVESNPEVNYDSYPNCITIHPEDKVFGYHKYMNIGIKKGKANYVVLANNDLGFTKNWASEIIKQMKLHPDIMSASPLCPETQNKSDWQSDYFKGYGVRRELNGWCLFVKREVFSIIGDLCEDVMFWYSDNIYADQLQHNGIIHALIPNSTVHHHENNLGTTGQQTLDQSQKDAYTMGQYKLYQEAKEKLLKTNVKSV